jgi:hypothetical protein
MEKSHFTSTRKPLANSILCYYILVIFIQYGCSNSNTSIEVVHCLGDSSLMMCTVYSSDTNWLEMELKAKELIGDTPSISAVGFFCQKEKVPTVKEDFSISPGEYFDYHIATFKYDDEIKKMRLFKHPKNYIVDQ